jgi:hypothetical protein
MIFLGVDPIATRAYIGGLIDGEGYIGIGRRMPTERNHMSAPKYSPRVSISMTDREPVDFVAKFCGWPQLVTFRTRGKNKTIYDLDLENQRCVDLLTEVFPYLICKKGQAEKALAMSVLRSESRQHGTKVLGIYLNKTHSSEGFPYRVFGLSDEYIARCDALYQTALIGATRSGNGFRFPGGAK